MGIAQTTIETGPPRLGEDNERDATVLARVVALKRMPVNDLKAEWKKLFDTDAPNNSRGFLELRLAHRIQELTYGGLARETTKLLNALADEVAGKPGRKSMIADSRNPVVGTRLVREWDGAEHTTTCSAARACGVRGRLPAWSRPPPTSGVPCRVYRTRCGRWPR